MDTPEDEKAAFAALLLKTPNEPFVAALALFPEDTNKALRIANEWPRDPVVITATTALIEDGADLAALPTKADLARAIWHKMLDRCTDVEDFTKLGKLYAEVRGFITKPDNVVNLQTNVDNRVMVVKDHGTNEEWENKAITQQRNLQSVSTSKH